MREQINNRKFRQKVLKDLITQLHNGRSIDAVKKSFEEVFTGVSAEIISQAEHAQISENLPVSEAHGRKTPGV